MVHVVIVIVIGTWYMSYFYSEPDLVEHSRIATWYAGGLIRGTVRVEWRETSPVIFYSPRTLPSKMNLILLKPRELTGKDKRTVILDKADARTRHIVGHLRKRSGGAVSVGVVGGSKGNAIVRLPSSDQVQGNTSREGKNQSKEAGKEDANIVLELSFDGAISSPPSPQITLVLAIPQPKRLKALWSVVASMGVTRIVLIRAQLSPYGEHCRTSRFIESLYRPLIEEGMAQGGHVRPVAVNVDVDEVVSRTALEELGLVSMLEKSSRTARVFLDCGDESGTVVPPARNVVMRSCSASGTSCANNIHSTERCANNTPHSPPSAVLAVGPERGWTDSEAELFQEAGFSMASLGSSILRVDTAVVAGLAIVSAALDECHVDDGIEVDNSKRQRIH